jgi:hypothetical protein
LEAKPGVPPPRGGRDPVRLAVTKVLRAARQ